MLITQLIVVATTILTSISSAPVSSQVGEISNLLARSVLVERDIVADQALATKADALVVSTSGLHDTALLNDAAAISNLATDTALAATLNANTAALLVISNNAAFQADNDRNYAQSTEVQAVNSQQNLNNLHQEVTQITLDAGNRVNAMVPLQAALSAAALPVNPNPAYNPAVLYQYGQLLISYENAYISGAGAATPDLFYQTFFTIMGQDLPRLRAETGLDYEGSDWVYALTANFNAFAQTIIPVFQEIFKINMGIQYETSNLAVVDSTASTAQSVSIASSRQADLALANYNTALGLSSAINSKLANDPAAKTAADGVVTSTGADFNSANTADVIANAQVKADQAAINSAKAASDAAANTPAALASAADNIASIDLTDLKAKTSLSNAANSTLATNINAAAKASKVATVAAATLSKAQADSTAATTNALLTPGYVTNDQKAVKSATTTSTASTKAYNDAITAANKLSGTTKTNALAAANGALKTKANTDAATLATATKALTAAQKVDATAQALVTSTGKTLATATTDSATAASNLSSANTLVTSSTQAAKDATAAYISALQASTSANATKKTADAAYIAAINADIAALKGLKKSLHL